MDEKKLHINLEIGTQKVSLNVTPADELVYRNAAKVLNDKFSTYAKRFPQLSLERLWIYVAFDIAVNLHSDARNKDLEPYIQAIQNINTRIENALKNDEQQ